MNFETLSDHLKYSTALRHAIYNVKREGLSYKRCYFLLSIYILKMDNPFRMYELDLINKSRPLVFYYIYSFLKFGFLNKDHFTYTLSDKAMKYINNVLQLTDDLYKGDQLFPTQKC
jgi:hypothetical protein